MVYRKLDGEHSLGTFDMFTYRSLGSIYVLMALLGEQAAAAWKSVNRSPLAASLSRFGVLISPPKQERSLNPRSSATMTRKLGRLVPAVGPASPLEAFDALISANDESRRAT